MSVAYIYVRIITMSMVGVGSLECCDSEQVLSGLPKQQDC